MSEVQLLNVKLSRIRRWQEPDRFYPKYRYPAAALQWAAQRCREAEMLVLSASFTSASADEAIAFWLRATAHTPALLECHIQWSDLLFRDKERLNDNNAWAHDITVQLARSAHGLRTFSGFALNLHSFPALPSLKHLMLDLPRMPLSGGMGGLGALVNLETLRLYCAGSAGLPADEASPFDCPALKLAELRQLRRVALSSVVPEGISVPRGCRVHARFYEDDTVRHPMWGVLCPASLWSLDWDLNIDDSDSQGLEDNNLPCLLSDCMPGLLDRFNLCVYKWAVRRLSAPLVHLQYLTINAVIIELHVPAATKWKWLHLSAGDHLHVSFEDVDAFARNPPAFSFENGGVPFMLPQHQALLDLNAALVRHHHHSGNWVSMENFLRNERGIRHLCNICLPGSIPEMEGVGFEDHFEHLRCMCEACEDCLTRLGKIAGTRSNEECFYTDAEDSRRAKRITEMQAVRRRWPGAVDPGSH